MNATSEVPVEAVPVTKDDIERWFNDFIATVGDEKKNALFDEITAFIWTNLVTKLEKDREAGVIEYTGAPRLICTLEDMRQLLREFEIASLEKTTKPSLDKVRDFLAGQIEGLLKHRNVTLTKEKS